MNRSITIFASVVICLFFFVGVSAPQAGDEPSVQTQDQNYWQEVIGNKNKILITLPPKTVEKLGTNGIRARWGNYYKSKGKYFVAVNKNNFKKMLSKRWKKSQYLVERDLRWQELLKKSQYEKEKVGKYLEGQGGDVSPQGGGSGASTGGSSG